MPAFSSATLYNLRVRIPTVRRASRSITGEIRAPITRHFSFKNQTAHDPATLAQNFYTRLLFVFQVQAFQENNGAFEFCLSFVREFQNFYTDICLCLSKFDVCTKR